MKYIFIPFSKESNPHLFLSCAFAQEKCEYLGLPEIKIEKRFAKRKIIEKAKKSLQEICFSLKTYFKIGTDDICIIWGFGRINIYIGMLARFFGSKKKIVNINLLDHTPEGG